MLIFGLCFTNSGSAGLIPMSPHIQQNGFQPLPPQNTVGQQQSYAPPQGVPPPMAVAMNNQPVVGSVPVPCPPAGAGVSGQGTWTGNSTLTYTQTMQPPDPRNHHPSFCMSRKIPMFSKRQFTVTIFFYRAPPDSCCAATRFGNTSCVVFATGTRVLVLCGIFWIGYAG